MAEGKRASMLQKLKKAKMTGTGNNFRDGKYRAIVKSMGFKDGHKGTRYQVEFVILTAQKVAVVSPKTQQPLDITPNSVGSTVDWLCVKLDKDDEPGQGNLRRFILELVGALEASDDDYEDTLCELSDLDKNGNPLEHKLEPGKGLLIDVETVRIETVRNKKEIVVQKFSHVPDDQQNQEAMVNWMNQLAAFNAQAPQQQLPASA